MNSYKRLFLFFFLICGLSVYGQVDSISKRKVVYDTVIIEKPPVVINKKVYVVDDKIASGAFILDAGLSYNINAPNLSLYEPHLRASENSFSSFSFKANAGYQKGFLRYLIGLGFSSFKIKGYFKQSHTTYDSTLYSYTDTLDSYYSVQNGDTSWYHVTEEYSEYRHDTLISYSEHPTEIRYSVIQIPVSFSYPFYIKKVLFYPSVGFASDIIISQKVKPAIPYPIETKNILFSVSAGVGVEYEMTRQYFLVTELNLKKYLNRHSPVNRVLLVNFLIRKII